MVKPTDFDSAQRQTTFGESKKLPADGYICRIIRVKESTSKAGKPMLKIALDIDDGEYKGFFREVFDRRVKYKADAEWPCIAIVMTQNDDGSTNGGFKNFIECVKESNNGWQPMWGDKFESHFSKQLVGCVFKVEEYEGNDGKKHQTTKPDFAHFKSVQQIRDKDFKVPEFVPAEPKRSNNGVPDGYTNYTPYVNDMPPASDFPADFPEDDLSEGFQMIDEEPPF